MLHDVFLTISTNSLINIIKFKTIIILMYLISLFIFFNILWVLNAADRHFVVQYFLLVYYLFKLLYTLDCWQAVSLTLDH